MHIDMPYAPITITLETREEVQALINILNEVRDLGSKNREEFILARDICNTIY